MKGRAAGRRLSPARGAILPRPEVATGVQKLGEGENRDHRTAMETKWEQDDQQEKRMGRDGPERKV